MELTLDMFHEEMVVELSGGPYIPLKQANKLFAERLAEAPTVLKSANYGHFESWHEPDFEYMLDSKPTHTAKLVCIQELKK